MEGGGTVNFKNSNTYTGQTVVKNNSTLLLEQHHGAQPEFHSRIVRHQQPAYSTRSMTLSQRDQLQRGLGGRGGLAHYQRRQLQRADDGHCLQRPATATTPPIGFTKMGPGQLILTDPYNNDTRHNPSSTSGTICVQHRGQRPPG